MIERPYGTAKALEAKVTPEGRVLMEDLEKMKRDKETHGEFESSSEIY